ncbi:MAG: type II toxin-antitoxin system YafQ family toxin [Holophagales bacterium]|jgi:mRNA interferase YafQ|nr:type II toxin-antitoxin system YafQ family toxin [Holophagales bacterium]
MRNPVRSNQFKRDVKKAEKRGKQMGKLRNLLLMLIKEQPLPQAYLDHQLKGNWKDHRGAHIEPDWILVYRIEGNDLHLTRTGTHSDIFAI